jgi:hypothetical protein
MKLTAPAHDLSEERGIREAGRSAAVVLSGVAIFSFLTLLLTMPLDVGIVDEGIVLSDAMRVLHGDIIHRDFNSLYAPAQYYVIAGLFRLFGAGFMLARLYDLAVRAAILTALFHIIRQQCPLLVTLFFTVVCGLWLLAIGFYLYPIYPCILLSLVGSYLIIPAKEESKPTPIALAAAGACTGLAALFRYDVGFYLLVAHFVSMGLLAICASGTDSRGRRVLEMTMTYGAGTTLIFLPIAIVLVWVSALSGFVADVIDYSLKYYSLMRGLPFPDLQTIWTSPEQAVVYLPLVAIGLALFELPHQLRARRTGRGVASEVPSRAVAYLTVFGSVSAFLFLKGAVRVSPVHMLLGVVPTLVISAVLISLWSRRTPPMRVVAVVVVLLALAPAADAAKREMDLSRWERNRSIAGWLAVNSHLIAPSYDVREACDEGPASGIAKLGENYARVATYIGAHTRPNDQILIALDRHDKIFANPVALYFASGRLPGTHWHEFYPGLQTRADIQLAIISDLKHNRVQWVVRDASFDYVNEPNGSARSSGITILDHYLDQNYRPVASSGKVAIWLALGEVEPPVSRNQCEPTSVKVSP